MRWREQRGLLRWKQRRVAVVEAARIDAVEAARVAVVEAAED
jgi:hypothetical protein